MNFDAGRRPSEPPVQRCSCSGISNVQTVGSPRRRQRAWAVPIPGAVGDFGGKMLRSSIRRVGVIAVVSATLSAGLLFFGLSGPARAVGSAYQLSFSLGSTYSGPVNASGTLPVALNSITVYVEDNTGAQVTSDSGRSITLKIATNPTSATLACTAGTTVTDSGGMATFTAFNVTGSASKLAFTSPAGGPASLPLGNTQTIDVSVEDANGNVVSTDSSTSVTLSPGTGSPTIGGGCLAAATTSDGVATFTGCTFGPVGTGYTITASATGLTSATSNPFNVTAAAKLAFTTEPANGETGVPLAPIVVSVEDANGIVDTADTGHTVSLNISNPGTNPGGGTLTGCSTPTESSGSFTFTGCTITGPGTGYTLIAAVSSGPSLSSTTSTAFNIANVAYQLAFTSGPNSTGPNIGQTIEVSVEDNMGNLVPTATNLVTLAIGNNSGGGTLTCTATLTVAAVNGVATFTGCAISAVGTNYTLTATATGLVPATSLAFTISTASIQTLPATFVSNSSAVLNGTFVATAAGETYDFEYGTSPSFGSGPVGSGTTNGSGTVSASFLVTGLTSGTQYYFEFFTSIGPAQNGYQTFTTTTGPVVTQAATSVTATTAVLNGTVNPGGVAQTCNFAYGTSIALGGATIVAAPSPGSGSSPVAESVAVSGLTANTTYYFQLECSNGNGGILSFTTSSSGAVVTQAATSITATSAVLNGTVNPGGVAQTCDYLYGTSSTLAGAASTSTFSTPAVSTVQSEPMTVSGLTPNTTYYFELVCQNGNGGILSFTTSTASQVTQIYGTDPIGTSIAISEQEFPTTDSAQAVVLARDDFFADALAGGPLAAAVDGPMLLTEGAPQSATLDPRTEAEIERVLAPGGTVYVLGGDLAIAQGVDSTLQSLGYSVVREAGSDEYATAVDIAEQLGNPSTIFEATGLSFYDALSAVPAAIASHAAILLTDGSTQAPETAAYLAAHPGDTRYAIGGPLAAAGADPGATSVYGADLYATSAAVATTFFPHATLFGAATSATFTDALGGGAYMATGGRSGPLLIVNPSAPLPTEILPYLASLAPGTPGVVFGGPLAVGPDVVAALAAAVG